MIKNFEISPEQLEELLRDYPNIGKNSHIGSIALRVVKWYFLSIDANAIFKKGTNGADLTVTYNGVTENFEIKGTADLDISWQKLKVSSLNCYNALVNGMRLIRVTGIGQLNMRLFFMKYGEDFDLRPEARWTIVRKK